MKKIAGFISAIVLQLCVIAQPESNSAADTVEKEKKVPVQGKITGFPDNSVVKLIALSGSVLDSCLIKEGVFLLHKNIENEAGPLTLRIIKDSINKYAKIFIGNEPIEINGSIDDFPEKLHITGSPDHHLKTDLDKILEDVLTERQKNVSDYITIKLAGKMTDSIWKIFWGQSGSIKMLDDETHYRQQKFIEKNINSYYALYLLTILKGNYGRVELEKLMSKLTPTYRESKYASAINTSLKNKEFEIGSRYLNFTAFDKDNKTVSFSDYFTGKYLLVEFSTPYCQFCLKAIEPLKTLAQSNDKKLDIVTVYVDEGKGGYADFSTSDKKPWSVIWDKKGRFGEAYSLYNIIGTPTFFLFGSDGRLLLKQFGFDEKFSLKIESLLK